MAVDEILKGVYPGKAHARRVVDYIRTKISPAEGFLFLTGAPEVFYDNTDMAIPFRQRRAFMYLSGVNLPNCHLIYEISNDRTTLFIPPVDPEDILWSGTPSSPEELLSRYNIDAVLYNTDLQATLDLIGRKTYRENDAIFTLASHAPGLRFPEGTRVDSTILEEAIDECRVSKDEYEVALLQKACNISSAAHRAVIASLKRSKNEAELDGVFLGECTRRGTKIQAYPSIVASGRTAATMHYESNNQDLYIDGKAKDVVVVDAGAEWNCYGADITRTLPISGKFTRQSRSIYDIVLKMQESCISMLKEGVLWDDAHVLAHKIAIDGLLEVGILKGNKDEIFATRISTGFMPHGLGHFLGMDTHDTGGQPNSSDPDPLFKYLRIRRTLPAGCVVTVEPGLTLLLIHFNEATIRPLLQDEKLSKYIDAKVLDDYWDVGGIWCVNPLDCWLRLQTFYTSIEDDILVTQDGFVNLTDVVKDPDELEGIIAEA